MSRPAMITYEQIAAAADMALGQGLQPTMRLIRERIGNVGSMGTVARLLQQWRASKAQVAAPALSLPVELQRAIVTFTEQHVAAAQARLEASLDEQQKENADLAEENERLCEHVERQRIDLELKTVELVAAEARTRQLGADLAQARAECEREQQRAQQARIELAREQLRLEWLPRMESELAELRAAVASERTSKVTAEQSAAVLAVQRDDLANRLDEARAHAAQEQAKLAQLQARLDMLTGELADARVAVAEAVARQGPPPAMAVSEGHPIHNTAGDDATSSDANPHADTTMSSEASTPLSAAVASPERSAKSSNRRDAKVDAHSLKDGA
ncbi:DNA-binding protein [Rugamonas apoptosis]|uniref:DNA-binding protein n=1 Tax=Rugamonas apoptosis TaxID=2758570 RepID=A0A7W2IKC0_9BURK|nr:DNA-binding protein [Rugamonas apoptosis]MBA5687211.1 DNA-binding protein [Rugamonas apoptosis]